MRKDGHIEGVMVCVGLGNLLSRTLSNVKRLFDKLVVVTGTLQWEVVDICNREGVDVVATDCYKEFGDAFNKGRMLNAGLDSLEFLEWVVFLDCDVLFPDDMVYAIENYKLERRFLYYNVREHLHGWENGEGHIVKFDWNRDGLFHDDSGPWGFFQLFWWEDAERRLKSTGGKLPVCFPSAGGVDSWFAHQWIPAECQKLQCSPVVHLYHGDKGAKWNCEDSLWGRWKWCGSSAWPKKYNEKVIVNSLPKPCLFRRLDVMTLESETTVLVKSIPPVWKKPTRNGYSFYEWHWKEIK